MRTASVQQIASIAVGIVILFSGVASGQSSPPEKAKGISSKPISTINLGEEIEAVQGRVLRAVLVTVEPGGGNPLHNHVDRPEIIYVLKGRLTDHRGDQSKDYGPGEAITSGKSTTHWIENRGSEPVSFIGVSIVKQP
jgi:quercetin dioxygenase-like cupin family protein